MKRKILQTECRRGLTALSKDGILSAEFTRGGLGGFRTLSQLVYLHDAHAKFSDLTDTGF